MGMIPISNLDNLYHIHFSWIHYKHYVKLWYYHCWDTDLDNFTISESQHCKKPITLTIDDSSWDQPGSLPSPRKIASRSVAIAIGIYKFRQHSIREMANWEEPPTWIMVLLPWFAVVLSLKSTETHQTAVILRHNSGDGYPIISYPWNWDLVSTD